MNLLAAIPDWILRFAGARPASGESEVWFGFEGMDPGWALLLAGAAAFWIGWTYVKGPGELSREKRLGLAFLRFCFVLLVLLMLTHPVLRVGEKTTSRGTLLVLMDASASMDLKDTRREDEDKRRVRIAFGNERDALAQPEPSRRELVRAVAANPELDLWPRILERADVRVVPFGREAGPARNPEAEDGRPPSLEQAAAFFEGLPSGETATAIADGLSGAFRETAGSPLTGVLLITDGANNAGAPFSAAAEMLARRDLPLFVYAPGVEVQRDLSVLSFSGPAMAFAREEAVLNVRLQATGLEGETTELVLSDGEETVERQEIAFEEDGEVEVSFRYTPEEEGEYNLRVRAEPLEGEATAENNEADLRLRVLDRRVRVLVIEREPRWDFRYLLDTLKRDRRVEVRAVMLEGDETLGRDPDSGFLAELPSPEELLEYVIVVLGDVDPEELSPEHLEALDALARQTGGGLVFHAGPQYNPYGYGGTSLESLLPVRLLSEVEDPARRYESPVALRLTREGRRSPLLRLDPDPTESESIWRSFPGVRWTASTGPAKPGAEVLLVDPTERKQAEGRAQPVLVRMSAGRGQVFYLGFDETWRWRSRVGEEHYLSIWGQIFLKLGVERLTSASDLVQINTVRNSYALGESVLVSGRIFEPDFQPLEAEEVTGTLTIEPEDGDGEPIRRELVFRSRPGRPGDFETEILASVPGRHTVRTDRDPEAEVVFSVDAANLELRDPSLHIDGLRQLAGEHGEVFREEDLDQLPERVAASLPTIREVRPYEMAFHPLVYFLLLFLPVLEWTIRRIAKLK